MVGESGFEPLATWLFPHMVHRARLELAYPEGHRFLRLARLPFRHLCIVVGPSGFEADTRRTSICCYDPTVRPRPDLNL